MADVFISYKAEDRKRIETLVQSLQADGYSVWWDQHIRTGDEWRRAIERELDSAKCVIVAWTKNSIGPEGRFVRDEASRAQRRNVYIPVLLDAIEPPLGFGESQATSLRAWRGNRSDERYRAVLAAVRRVAGEAAVPGQTAAKQGINRRTLIAGGAAATLTLAGIGSWVLLKPRSFGGLDSIAVLPYENLSGDVALASFSDGIAGEIRNILTRVAGLKVAGSLSSAAVREDDAQTAARKLGVSNILTGSVRQTASIIRVSAELIDGGTGMSKWSHNYDRAPGDVIKVQAEIAESVTRALAVALSPSVRKALAAETDNITAQTLAFQARDLSWQFTVPAFRRSLQLVDQAIAIDPNYGRAYALKAFFVNNLASQVAKTPTELAKARGEALKYAKIAVEKVPNLPIARSGLGYAYFLTLQVNKSLREHEIAISLPGSEPDVLRNYGYAITCTGRFGEALRYVDEALGLDPLNAGSHTAHATVLFDARRYEEMVLYAQKLKRESPELFDFDRQLGRAFLQLGRTTEAGQAIGQDAGSQALLAARSGDRNLAFAKLAEFRKERGEMSNVQYAEIYAQLEANEEAFAALERAWKVRDISLLDIKIDPFLDPLRSDSRFQALVKRVGFAP